MTASTDKTPSKRGKGMVKPSRKFIAEDRKARLQISRIQEYLYVADLCARDARELAANDASLSQMFQNAAARMALNARLTKKEKH